MASSYQVFEAAAQIEEACGLMYREAARRFEADPGARELFRKLEQEEEQHALRVRLLAARYRSDPRSFGSALLPKLSDLEPLAEEARRELAALQAGEWPAELAAVKLRFAELERRFANMHSEFLAPGIHPQVVAFFSQLAEQDREHDRLLEPG